MSGEKQSQNTKLENGSDGRPSSKDVSPLTRIIAISALWPWTYQVFFSETALIPASPLLKIEPIFRSASFLAITATFLLLLFLGKRVLAAKRLILLAAFVAIASPWPIILTLAFTELSPAWFAFECIAWALAGIAAGCLMFLAHPVPRSSTRHMTLQALSIAFMLGALIYLFCNAIPLLAARIIVLALPYVSLLGLYLNRSTFFGAQWYANLAERPPHQLSDSFEAQPSQLVYGLVCGMGLGIGISLAIATTGHFPPALYIGFCTACPVGLALSQVQSKLAINNVEWFLMPVICMGILPIVIGNDTVTIGCCALLAFIYTLYELLHVVQLNEQMHEQPEIAPYIFAAGQGVFFAGVTIGWIANCLLLTLFGYDSPEFFVTIIVIVLLVIWVVSYLGRPSARTGQEVETVPPLSSAEQEEIVFAEIAEEGKLTARQAEIFAYLAHGRNAPYIAEELVVSYHTVKAHMNQIYRKLGVHSQQELIDLVEERFSQGA